MQEFADLVQPRELGKEEWQPLISGVSVFVPGGPHPPLPVLPFATLGRAQKQMPAELVFDPTFMSTDAAQVNRTRFENVVRCLFQWLVKGSVAGGDAPSEDLGTLPEKLDSVCVHPGGELYVSPSR